MVKHRHCEEIRQIVWIEVHLMHAIGVLKSRLLSARVFDSRSHDVSIFTRGSFPADLLKINVSSQILYWSLTGSFVSEGQPQPRQTSR